MMTARHILMLGCAIPLAVSLAACGGGGGGVNSTPTPAPLAPPPPPPPPPPPSTNFDTAEYRQSNAAVSSKALSAYQAGATGTGITAAVVDSGINPALSEFAGKISTASADLAGTRPMADEDGHGTAVAAIIGAVKNDSGMHGVAFNSTLLIAKTDEPGSCTNTSGPVDQQGCQHPDSAIARGVDLARTNQARVINISLGGSAAGGVLRAAIDRATAQGIVIVISAGNDAAATPDPLAQIALDPVARGLVIIAGALDANDALASFSNQAGGAQAQYLTALGSRVVTVNENGALIQFSGTSASAPVISGAVALLAQAFPNLTGRQIVDLLFNSARDLGTAGDDATYGQGALDLARAFQPQGQTSLAGSMTPVSIASNATMSPAMGDAAKAGTAQSIMLDGYGRAYVLDLARTLSPGARPRALAPALAQGGRQLAAAGRALAFSVSVTDGGRGTRMLLTREEAELARATAGFVASRIAPRTEFALGFHTSAGTIAAALKGKREPAFLVAEAPTRGLGFERQTRSAVAVRHQLADLGIMVTAETGSALLYDPAEAVRLRGDYGRHGYDRISLGLDGRLGKLAVGVEASRLGEKETVLGARFGPALGGNGATSWFLDVDAAFDLGRGWQLGGTLRQGITRAPLGTLRSNAFGFDVIKIGVVDGNDRVALRMAQPLRIVSGGLRLTLPENYDYRTGITTYAVRRLGLSPVGQQIDLEASYARPMGPGWLTTNLFYRQDPGNLWYAPDDIGVALRFGMDF